MGFISSLIHLDWNNFKFKDFIEGCSMVYLQDFYDSSKREKVEKVAKYRIRICDTCHMNDNGFCQNNGTKTIKNVETGAEVLGCGCSLKCKTALLSANCPAFLWKAV